MRGGGVGVGVGVGSGADAGGKRTRTPIALRRLVIPRRPKSESSSEARTPSTEATGATHGDQEQAVPAHVLREEHHRVVQVSAHLSDLAGELASLLPPSPSASQLQNGHDRESDSDGGRFEYEQLEALHVLFALSALRQLQEDQSHSPSYSGSGSNGGGLPGAIHRGEDQLRQRSTSTSTRSGSGPGSK